MLRTIGEHRAPQRVSLYCLPRIPNVLAFIVSSVSSPSEKDTPAWGCRTGCLCLELAVGKAEV